MKTVIPIDTQLGLKLFLYSTKISFENIFFSAIALLVIQSENCPAKTPNIAIAI